jgi:AraC family transcriptional regulator of adaptative response/methylated-DNA-[protein]-cysteine methyltransferase
MNRTGAVADRIRAACEYVEAHVDEPVRLEALAGAAGMSPFHFLRSFKSHVGVTPKRYVDEVRLKRLKSGLRSAGDVAAAVYDAGYGSASRVYERADSRLGMTPAQYRRGGLGVKISYAAAETPVGLMMVGATDRGICFVQFGENSQDLLHQLHREYPNAGIAPMEDSGDPQLAAWVAALTKHLKCGGPHGDLPLDVRATAFQMRVWTYLQSIPAGELQSYGEVAQAIGKPGAARAVARACASNVCAIVIPCHRVIRGTGELGGYKWGAGRKRALIDRERALARR